MPVAYRQKRDGNHCKDGRINREEAHCEATVANGTVATAAVVSRDGQAARGAAAE